MLRAGGDGAGMGTNGHNAFDDDTTVAMRMPPARASEHVAFTFLVVDGPDAGTSFMLDPTTPLRSLIGKGPACDVKLTDPAVSRRHLAVSVEDQRVRIQDLDSTNGTLVDGVAVRDAYLRGGEVIRVGTNAIRVEQKATMGTVPIARDSFGRVIGASVAMRRLYPLCERLARSVVPVVIEGETGTGKEQLAEALHEQGPRKGEAFVVFDCTAVAPTLIEAELFGHERGAFTGAVSTHKGVFEVADRGTLLIDEIGDMPIELQAKLLRAIEGKDVRRVGGQQPIRVDVRLLVATRRDLDKEVQEGRFRDDLFHRIAVARLELPPLRDRRGDVALLARHCASQLGAGPQALPPELLSRWEAYPWPGNIRELKNAVARWLALGDLSELDLDASAEPVAGEPLEAAGPRAASNQGDPIARILASGLPLAEARQLLIDEFEKRYVQHALEAHHGNVTRAAAAAGIARRHLQRLKAKGGRGNA
jgi:DNA-binding NtrC family response regulator